MSNRTKDDEALDGADAAVPAIHAAIQREYPDRPMNKEPPEDQADDIAAGGCSRPWRSEGGCEAALGFGWHARTQGWCWYCWQTWQVKFVRSRTDLPAGDERISLGKRIYPTTPGRCRRARGSSCIKEIGISQGQDAAGLIPNGWCWYCWNTWQIMKLEEEEADARGPA